MIISGMFRFSEVYIGLVMYSYFFSLEGWFTEGKQLQVPQFYWLVL